MWYNRERAQEGREKWEDQGNPRLRDLLGRTIRGMMEGEMETPKKEKQEEDPAYTDSRNGYKTKTLRSNYGPVEVNVPQDRKSDYDPKIVPKYGRDISEIDEKIIEIYGFEVSEAMVTSVTNKILPEIEEWQKRPLSAVYPIVYIDGNPKIPPRLQESF